MLLALATACRLRNREFLGHIEPDLFLDDFAQSDISSASIANFTDQRPAQSAAAGIQLAHTTRDQVDQNVGVANLHQSLLAQFAIQKNDLVELVEPDTICV